MNGTLGWVLCAMPLAATLAGCATDRGKLIPEFVELALGEQVDAQIRQQYTPCPPERCPGNLVAFVTDLGQQLAAHSDRRDIEYHFTVLDTEEINAFAAPGGWIYVTVGLLRQVTHTSELAGVLGHEVGHVVERHGAEELEERLQESVAVDILDGLIAGKSDAIGQAAQLLVGVYGLYHSRERELEADGHGVVLSARVGMSPQGLIDFFQVLDALLGSPSSTLGEWLRDHPLPKTRIEHARALIERRGIDAAALPLDSQPPWSEFAGLVPPPRDGGP